MVYVRGYLEPVLRFVYGLFKGLFGTSFKVCLRGYLELFKGLFRAFLWLLRAFYGLFKGLFRASFKVCLRGCLGAV